MADLPEVYSVLNGDAKSEVIDRMAQEHADDARVGFKVMDAAKLDVNICSVDAVLDNGLLVVFRSQASEKVDGVFAEMRRVIKARFSMPAIFEARFMFLSMGPFPNFASFTYKDSFSICLPILASRWVDPDRDGHYTPDHDVKNNGGRIPYPFDVDWMLEGACNELHFMSSLKMKLFVLCGFLQMIVGVPLRWSNAAHDKSWLDFICERLPMMFYMQCSFGWMDVVTLYECTHPVDTAPSIISSRICMAMGQQDRLQCGKGPCSSRRHPCSTQCFWCQSCCCPSRSPSFGSTTRHKSRRARVCWL